MKLDVDLEYLHADFFLNPFICLLALVGVHVKMDQEFEPHSIGFSATLSFEVDGFDDLK